MDLHKSSFFVLLRLFLSAGGTQTMQAQWGATSARDEPTTEPRHPQHGDCHRLRHLGGIWPKSGGHRRRLAARAWAGRDSDRRAASGRRGARATNCRKVKTCSFAQPCHAAHLGVVDRQGDLLHVGGWAGGPNVGGRAPRRRRPASSGLRAGGRGQPGRLHVVLRGVGERKEANRGGRVCAGVRACVCARQ